MTYADLGAQVEAEWATTGYDPSKFPGIAKRALDAVALPELERERLASKPPPRIPFENTRFHIEVRRNSVSAYIREESFIGALRVAEGTGIRTQFTFEPAHATKRGGGGAAPRPTALAGSLQQRGSILADANAEAAEIAPMAESIFPLKRPLVIVVITINRPPRSPRPWLYQRPGIALHERRVLKDLSAHTDQLGDAANYARWYYDIIDVLRRARKGRRLELRFFLALLMTQQKKDFLLKLVADWTHTDRRESLEFVAHWVEKLIRLNVLKPIDPNSESVPFAAFTHSWSRMHDPNALTFLLRHVRLPGDRAPHGRIPPV